MPSGLAIDHEKQMKGAMPKYAQHVVIHTGRDDWASKIEEEIGGKGERNLARTLKEMVGRAGKFHDVCIYNNRLIQRGLSMADLW